MNINLPSDAYLLSAYQATGDPDLFGVLVGRYQQFVYGVCRRILGDSALADDATQMTFISLARSPDGGQENISGWLHRTATRAALAIRQREKRHIHISEDLAAPNDRSSSELSQELDAALDALNVDERELIVRLYFINDTQAMIAAERGVDPRTIGRQANAALQRMRAILDQRGFMVVTAMLMTALTSAAEPPVVSEELRRRCIEPALAWLRPEAPKIIGIKSVCVAAAVVIGIGVPLAWMSLPNASPDLKVSIISEAEVNQFTQTELNSENFGSKQCTDAQNDIVKQGSLAVDSAQANHTEFNPSTQSRPSNIASVQTTKVIKGKKNLSPSYSLTIIYPDTNEDDKVNHSDALNNKSDNQITHTQHKNMTVSATSQLPIDNIQ